MDDRDTARLYLELGNVDPDEYRSGRARELAGLPGVERVTWWANNVPGRTELPMTVPEGSLLGVAEVDAGFVPPEPLPATTARLFRRFPRPSQGILTGTPTNGLLVVWISPRSPELATSLRDWADFVHIRHIAAAALPGFTHITPYENVGDTEPRYMHFYELDTRDPEGAYMDMARRMARYFGGSRTHEFRAWADFDEPGGRIVYCNTFRLLGQVGTVAS